MASPDLITPETAGIQANSVSSLPVRLGAARLELSRDQRYPLRAGRRALRHGFDSVLERGGRSFEPHDRSGNREIDIKLEPHRDPSQSDGDSIWRA
jgi:hypothetical protein